MLKQKLKYRNMSFLIKKIVLESDTVTRLFSQVGSWTSRVFFCHILTCIDEFKSVELLFVVFCREPIDYFQVRQYRLFFQ